MKAIWNYITETIFLPIDLMVEGMIIDSRDDLTALPFPSSIANIFVPSIFRPVNKITSLSAEQARNADVPKNIKFKKLGDM